MRLCIAALPALSLILAPPVLAQAPAPEPAAAQAEPKGSKARKPRPRNEPLAWVTDADYPQGAVATAVQGRTGFTLVIGTDGKVLRCDVTETSGSALLDQTACRLISQRALFWPGRGPNGKARADTWTSAVNWVMEQALEPVAAMRETITYFVETDGSVTNCVVVRDGVTQPPSPSCKPERTPRLFRPYLDASGHPVRRKVVQTSVRAVEDAN